MTGIKIAFDHRAANTDGTIMRTLVIEDAPRKVRIHYRYGGDPDMFHGFTLEKPWSYLLSFWNKGDGHIGCGIFFARKQLKNMEDPGLCYTPLPNACYSHKGPSICMGDFEPAGSRDIVQEALNLNQDYWNSVFNPELIPRARIIPQWMKGGNWLTKLAKWERRKPKTWVPAVKMPSIKHVIDLAFRYHVGGTRCHS